MSTNALLSKLKKKKSLVFKSLYPQICLASSIYAAFPAIPQKFHCSRPSTGVTTYTGWSYWWYPEYHSSQLSYKFLLQSNSLWLFLKPSTCNRTPYIPPWLPTAHSITSTGGFTTLCINSLSIHQSPTDKSSLRTKIISTEKYLLPEKALN